MIWLEFSGWFECRLATDPDPTDEPRGVSGYARALAGEPDFDRIVRLQPRGAVGRQPGWPLGVAVQRVVHKGQPVDGSPLVGARVELLRKPRFEGRNGIVAEAGYEPIVPFVLRISAKDGFRIVRAHADREKPPYAELQAAGLQPGLSAIGAETGVYDLAAVWADRAGQLKRLHRKSHDPVERAAIEERLTGMENEKLRDFYGYRMLYGFPLAGAASVRDPGGWLLGEPDEEAAWSIDFWLGGWDPDVLCGYMKGALGIPLGEPAVKAQTNRGAALRP